MGNRKVFIKLMASGIAFVLTASYSLYVSAEPESEWNEDISEQPVIQESVEESFEVSDYEDSEAEEDSDYEDENSDDNEYSEEESFDEESSEYSYDESSDYEPSYDESSDYELSYDEPDYDESSDYEEENSYVSSQPESSGPIIYYYGPSKEEEDSETTQFYEEESSEPSTTYQETSIDSSEMTSRDWETLKKRLDAEMGNKSADNAIRDIKDGEGSQNDNINYLMWGLVLIGMGLVIIGFIIYTTVYTKYKLTENMHKKSTKSGRKIKKS